jgi:hypothetical protein
LANVNTYKRAEIEDPLLNNSYNSSTCRTQHGSFIQISTNGKNSLAIENPHGINNSNGQSTLNLDNNFTESQPQTPSKPAKPIVTRDDAQMIDFAASFIFPCAFIIFNIIYWVIYLNMHVERKL